MATADIQKIAVFDSRIVQNAEKYCVNKGALSLTNAPYNAIGASGSQQTYNINVPSQNVFVDRGVEWSSTVYQTFQATTANVGAGNAGASSGVGVWTNPTAIYTPGLDFALCAFPLHQMCSTLTATINDTSVVMNLDTVLREVMRLTDYKKNRLIRTCPTMMDKYAIYSDAALAVNNVLSGFQNATEPAEVPNGAWFQLAFTDSSGNALSPAVGPAAVPQAGFYQTGSTFVLTYNGLPCRTPTFAGVGTAQTNILLGAVPQPAGGSTAVADGGTGGTYTLYIRWTTTEKLILSPFIFADAHEWSTGLFGINNIQLVMNLSAANAARCIRTSGSTVVVPNTVAFNNLGSSGSPFQNPRVNVQFLTPSLDLPLPPKSAVPFAEYPRYISTNVSPNGPIDALAPSTTLNSQTITLPQIPDAVIIYVKPDQASSTLAAGGNPNGFGDIYMPITGISVNFDNFAGLLSSHTTEQLYQMSVHNGLEMDYQSWSGQGILGAANASLPRQGIKPLVGGFLVLRMGQDICLQSGQAPGLVGNFTLQFRLTVANVLSFPVSPTIFVIAVNTGFFETLAGSSRIVKGVLSEADIIAAEPLPEMSHDGLARVVGTGFFDKIGSFITKAKDIYTSTKPAVSAMKNMLPEGKVKRALDAVGYGSAGAGMAGAAMEGMGRAGAGKRKGLAARLM